MKVLVTGSNGLVGRAVVSELTGAGHYVIRLVRSNPDRARGDLVWDPVSGRLERPKLEGLDAVVHLAGEPVMGLWTKGKKHRIYRSRVQPTEFLAEALAGLTSRPKVFLTASAVGFYGHGGDRWLLETEPAADSFLANVCQDWEKATAIAANAGIRVVNLRIGLVLSPHGGALRSLLPVFKTGLGGTLGSGNQYWSWIAITDLSRAITHALEKTSLSGPVNAVAPLPVTARDFARTLARTLGRPAFFPVPSFLLKLLPGGMGREMFLNSQRVSSEKLQKSGFVFEQPELERALQALTGPRL
jgi:uncharacterized protein (TIGR01777 family)